MIRRDCSFCLRLCFSLFMYHTRGAGDGVVVEASGHVVSLCGERLKPGQ